MISEKYTFRKQLSPKFIISTGRTGTKFLANFFNKVSDNIYARHEPLPNILKLRFQYATGRIKLDKAEQKFIKLKYKYYNSINKPVYIESNPYYGYIIPVIKKVFPNYQIVHIIRDGRTYLRSVMSRGIFSSYVDRLPYSLLSVIRLLSIEKNFYPKLFKDNYFKYIRDIWRIRAIDLKNDPYSSKWTRMSQIEKLAWNWEKQNTLIENALEGDNKTISIKFEDIFNPENNFNGLERIFKFFNLSKYWDSVKTNLRNLLLKKINETKVYLIPNWSDWNDKWKTEFNEITRTLMQKYSYY